MVSRWHGNMWCICNIQTRDIRIPWHKVDHLISTEYIYDRVPFQHFWKPFILQDCQITIFSISCSCFCCSSSCLFQHEDIGTSWFVDHLYIHDILFMFFDLELCNFQISSFWCYALHFTNKDLKSFHSKFHSIIQIYSSVSWSRQYYTKDSSHLVCIWGTFHIILSVLENMVRILLSLVSPI